MTAIHARSALTLSVSMVSMVLCASMVLYACDASHPTQHGTASGVPSAPIHDEPHRSHDHEGHDHGAGEGDVDWCVEHALPESACTKCDPSLIEAFRERGDWCAGHGFPESVCPICNPQRPPLGAGPGQVVIDAGVAERSGIRTSVAALDPGATALVVPAEVQLDPDRVAHVTSPVSGHVVESMVALGDRVEAGAPLVRLRSVDLGTARAGVARASVLLDVARRDLERQRELREAGINAARELYAAERAVEVAEAELAAARASVDVLGVRGGRGAELDITSPIHGVVLAKHATLGEVVSPSDPLFVVADTSKVWVIGSVSESDIAAVASGMPVEVRLDAWPERTWAGSLDWVAHVMDARTRALRVRVVVDNGDGALRPGLYGSLRILAGSSGAGVTVPSDAVIGLDEGAAVFVPLESDGAFEVRAVSIGRALGGRVEITAGLSPGERYVAEGAFVLKSELLRHVLGDSCVH